MQKRVDIGKASAYSVVINGIQIAAILAILLTVLLTDLEKTNIIYVDFAICIAAALITWGAVVDILQALTARRVNSQAQMLEEAYGQLESLNKTLRAQRHDFMSHLQVVGSLVEMGEYKEAGEYIDRVYGDIQSVAGILATANPAVNALLKVKLAEGQRRGIVIETHIQSKWEALRVPGWEMCRVLGNLIDNALDALAGTEEARVRITLSETPSQHLFSVENNGPQVPEAIRAKIFLSGFTTKGGERGMGLSIVSGIVREYGGGIELMSDEKRTAFSGWIPKRAL